MDSNFSCIHSVVEFVNVQDVYSYNEDFVCHFKFNDYVPQEGDRVAIFMLGWNVVKDYKVFEWVPVCKPVKDNEINGDIYSVTFSRQILPKNNEMYQICYLTGNCDLHGASSPFQFSAEDNATCIELQKSVSSESSKANNTVTDKQDEGEEIRKLKNENYILREALQLFISNKNTSNDWSNDQAKQFTVLNEKVHQIDQTLSQYTKRQDMLLQHSCLRKPKNYDKEIETLYQQIIDLEARVTSQVQEIDKLKTEVKESEYEYKKLFSQKVELDRKMDRGKNEDAPTKLNSCNFNIEDLKQLPPFPFPLPKK